MNYLIDWNVSREEWAACADEDLACSVFQTPAWGDVVLAAGLVCSIKVIGATFANGGRVLLPIAEIWRGRSGLSAYQSTPLSGYGGPIAVGPVNNDDVNDAVTRICTDWRLCAQSIVINGNPHRSLDLSAVFARRTIDAHLLDIEGGANAVAAAYNSNFKRGLKAAKRAGVEVRRSNAIEDLDSYFCLYHQAVERWGSDATSRHPKDMFVSLASLPKELFQIWMGEIAGVDVAGMIALYKGRTVYYWHGAFNLDFSAQSPSKAVFHEMILDAVERGYKCIDMLPSGGHPGVVRFKESMGARPRAFHEHSWIGDRWRKTSTALRCGVDRLLGTKRAAT